MKKSKKLPEEIYCFWKFSKGKWKLIETNFNGDGGSEWMHRKISEMNYEQRPGRAITRWDLNNGVTLLKYHWPIGVGFLGQDRLMKSITDRYDWPLTVDGGVDLFWDTLSKVEEIIYHGNKQTR